MSLQVCPFHTSEDVAGRRVGDEGGEEFVCALTNGHNPPGPFRWISFPEPPANLLNSGLTGELGLGVELPAALSEFKGQWVEYGVVEQAYAARCPQDFGRLIDLHGHTALYTEADRQANYKRSNYSASKFIASALGKLMKNGTLLGRFGPATGRWDYNSQVSWWAFPPEPEWSERLSWAERARALDKPMSYVPGSVE